MTWRGIENTVILLFGVFGVERVHLEWVAGAHGRIAAVSAVFRDEFNRPMLPLGLRKLAIYARGPSQR